MLQRIQDYFTNDVPHVWIFNPQIRSLFVCHADGTYVEHKGGIIAAPGTPIAVNIDEIFSALDEH